VLGLGTAFAVEGPINTFLRAQKLFPGPHLYAGAGIVVCWALAASLVPLMGKGNDNARCAAPRPTRRRLAVCVRARAWVCGGGWRRALHARSPRARPHLPRVAGSRT